MIRSLPMIRRNLRIFCGAVFFSLLGCGPMLAQQAPAPEEQISAPTGAPGVYIQDAGKAAMGWQLLSPNLSYRAYVPDSFGTTPHDARLGELQAVEYPGAHAAIQIHAGQLRVCVYRMVSPVAPVLVRLTEEKKKKSRVLGGGGLHVLTIEKSTHLAAANAEDVVPTTTLPSTACMVLFQPQAALAPGEYAVMFGLQNLAIMDFGVAAQ